MMAVISNELLEEAKPIIEGIARRRKKHSFAYFTPDDVQQEIWCMCLDALDRYSRSVGPIENFLTSHVTNRLINLKRDKYFRPGIDATSSGCAMMRMNLINALPLNDGEMAGNSTTLMSNSFNNDPMGSLLCAETIDYLRTNLSDHLVESFDDMLGGNLVRKPFVEEVRFAVAALLVERDGNE